MRVLAAVAALLCAVAAIRGEGDVFDADSDAVFGDADEPLESVWTVHAAHGTPVLHAALEARRPAAFGTTTRASRGFHAVVSVHAELGDFPEIGDEEDVRMRTVGRGAAEGFHVVELSGGMVKVGEYYAKIHIGGQMVRTQIDTGSATLALPMSGCKDCRAGDRRYDLEKSVGGKGRAIDCSDGDVCMANKCSPFSCGGCSEARACCSTREPEKCGFHLNFGDGSGAQGMLVRDDMEWGGITFPVVFGGINQDSPDFERNEVDGILGMAYPTLACNPSCVKPTFEAMVDHLDMKHVFQICITADSGRIVLGDWDRSLMKADPVWVDLHLSSPPTYYTMKLTGDLMVNDRAVVFPKYKLAIADSGTTLIVFNRRSFKILVDHLQEFYCDVPGLCGASSWFRPAHCTKISEKHRLMLPNLVFRMEGGFDVVLGPSEYLINYESKGPDYWCVGLMALDALSGGIDVIFGNTVMKKYVTIYDRENKRIGFGESNGDCKSSSKIITTDIGTDGDKAPKSASVASVAEPLPPAKKKTGAESALTTPKSAAPLKQKSGEGPFTKDPICMSALTCSACAAIGGGHCMWSSTSAKCIVGDPSRLMCTLDTLAGNVVYLILASVAGCVVLVICAAVGVCYYKKRQSATNDAAVDPEEAFETRVPLTEARSFLRRDTGDDQVETF